MTLTAPRKEQLITPGWMFYYREPDETWSRYQCVPFKIGPVWWLVERNTPWVKQEIKDGETRVRFGDPKPEPFVFKNYEGPWGTPDPDQFTLESQPR